jgi:hypothetical protein
VEFAGVAGRQSFVSVPCAKINFFKDIVFLSAALNNDMVLSREYVNYLARQIAKRLIGGQFVEAKDVNALTERIDKSLHEELSVEDRINEEVRAILEAYSDEMRRSGANYQDMFKRVKGELVRKYKAVL